MEVTTIYNNDKEVIGIIKQLNMEWFEYTYTYLNEKSNIVRTYKKAKELLLFNYKIDTTDSEDILAVIPTYSE